MKKRAISLASNHHTLRVGPPDSQRGSSGPIEPTPAALLRAVECSFKKHLLKPGNQEEGLEITVTGLRPIRLVTKRFGHTAFVAGVIRGENNLIESLTVCRAGMDNAEDEAAISAAGELILQDGTQEFVEALIAQVRDQPRPLAVHIHLDEDNYDDPAVRIVTHCLAECFFDQFGLEKEHSASDV